MKSRWAVKLAESGFKIAPLHHTDAVGACSCGESECASPGKHPLHRDWQAEATNDPAKVQQIFRDHPGCNYAVCPQDGQAVVDLDVGENKSGPDEWEKLLVQHEEAMDTLIVQTWSGGQHWYFLVPHTVGNANDFPVGIDVRGKGGYVLGPECEIAGKKYEVQSFYEPWHAPSWVVERMRRPNEKAEDLEAKYELDTLGAVNMVLNFLRVRPPAIEGQGGHDHTYATACMVIDRGISAEKCLELLIESGWNKSCEPPWDPDELAFVVGNAWRYRNRPPGDKGGDVLMDMVQDDIPEGAVDVNDLNMDALDEIEDMGARPRRSFRPLSERDLRAMPPPTWLVDGVLETDTLVLVYGAEQSYKSFIVLDLVLSVAAGMSWPDKEADALSPLTVIYIAGEGARGVGTDRREAWRHAHGIEDSHDLPFYVIPEMPHVQDNTDILQLVRDIEGADIKPDIVVLDTVVRAMVGLDENAAKDTGLLVDACDHIQRHFGCVVIAVHHTGKDEGRGARGSSNLPASFSARYYVEADRVMREVTIVNEKQKDADTWTMPVKGTAEEVHYTEGRKSLVFTEFHKQTAKIVADDTRVRQAALAHVLREVSLRHKDEAYGGAPKNGELTVSSAAEQLAVVVSTDIEDLAWKADVCAHLDTAKIGDCLKKGSFRTKISDLMPQVTKDPRGVAITDVDEPYTVKLKREGRGVKILIASYEASALDDAPMGGAAALSDEIEGLDDI